MQNEVDRNMTIGKRTKEWLAQFNMRLPIDSNEIPGFRHWVNFNGFSPQQTGHNGYDFAAYLTQEGEVVLGLPVETNIRAVADGVVYGIYGRDGWGYANELWIKHEKRYGGLTSGYCHIVPTVEEGKEVKKGDIIVTLWKDSESEEKGPLVHLHFMIKTDWQTTPIDPRFIDESISAYNMIPPENPGFTIPELPTRTPFRVEHFKKVDVGRNTFFKSKKRIG